MRSIFCKTPFFVFCVRIRSIHFQYNKIFLDDIQDKRSEEVGTADDVDDDTEPMIVLKPSSNQLLTIHKIDGNELSNNMSISQSHSVSTSESRNDGIPLNNSEEVGTAGDGDDETKPLIERKLSSNQLHANDDKDGDKLFNDIKMTQSTNNVDNSSLENADMTYRDGNIYHPLATSEEKKWFTSFMPYLIGKPRKMKRIFNSYMLARCIVRLSKPEIPLNSPFFRNVLKMTILLEQWPYRMAWVLVLVERYEPVKDMNENRTDETGDSLMDIMKNISENEDEVSLKKVYKYVVQKLIHASDDEDSKLLLDGDSVVFFRFLSEGGEDSMLNIKDVGCIDVMKVSLRAWCYNLPKYLLAQVSAKLDKYLLYIESNDSNWYVSFKKKSSVFEKSD